ncbi:hypothetical protein NMY22_g8502 [Coprinellus aureogranulatus]|nr:hypothetical protein NMY22_g8502 [Coprinellus aureogranulatus]
MRTTRRLSTIPRYSTNTPGPVKPHQCSFDIRSKTMQSIWQEIPSTNAPFRQVGDLRTSFSACMDDPCRTSCIHSSPDVFVSIIATISRHPLQSSSPLPSHTPWLVTYSRIGIAAALRHHPGFSLGASPESDEANMDPAERVYWSSSHAPSNIKAISD